jgi:tape measure domain-containing protein
MATNASLALILSANTAQFSTGLQRAEKQFVSFGNKLSNIGSTLSRSVSLPLVAIGGASVASAMKMESLRKGLTAVSGSAEAAEKQFNALKEVAKLPGLGLEEAVQGSINLQAAGFSAEQAEKSLKAFGNALATVGKGKADLEGVILALGQIQSKGKISAEEINQIAERVPQIRGAMQSAFGTADTTALQQMGISSQEFVAKITEELAKLPPVTGGMQNAFENLGDSVKTSLATVGDSIAKSFNLEELFNRIAAKIQSVSEWFQKLSPETQKFAAIAGGIAAAIGPLLTGFGFLTTKILPLLTSGIGGVGAAFTFLISPIGLVVAAIAGAVALIVANWDSIVQYFTQGDGAGVFNSLKALISRVMDIISATVSQAIAVIKFAWEKFGPTIIAAVEGALKKVMNIFDFVLNTIIDVIDFFKAIFSGNWEDAWNAVKRIFQRSINFVIDLLDGFISASAQIFNSLVKALGFEGFDAGIAKIHEFAESLKFVVPEAKVLDNGISDMTSRAVKNLDTITKTADKTATSLSNVAASVAAEAPPTIGAIGSRGVEQNALANPMDALATPDMGAVKSQIEGLNKSFEDHQAIIDATAAKYSQLGENIGSSMQVSATSIQDYTQQAGKALLNFILQAIKGFAAQAIAGLIAQSVATLGPAGLVAAAAAPGIVNGLFDSLIPKLAKGGVATGPTLGLFGEAGDEAIIPLRRLPELVGAMGGGTQQIVVTGQIAGDTIRISNERSSTRKSRTF